jgi:hypothetical protein
MTNMGVERNVCKDIRNKPLNREGELEDFVTNPTGCVYYEPMWDVQLKEKLGIELLVKFL